jgi:type II secretion system protein H
VASPHKSWNEPTGGTGFTLIEVLVVLFIVGLMASLIGLRTGLSTATVLEDESTRLQQTLESGIDRSRLTRAPVLWQASADGYRLSIREDGSDRLIAKHDLTTPVRILSVWREGVLQSPPYEFALSGRSPEMFRIRLSADQSPPFELRSTLLGRVNLVRG